MIRSLWHSIQIRYWSWQFAKSCRCNVSGLQVYGRCIVDAPGRIDVGSNVFVRSRGYNPVEITVSRGAYLKIGDNCFINQGVRIACSMEIQIGNGCLIGDECVILDNDYHAMPGTGIKAAPIIIMNNVWLATRVIVLRGITIGENSIVGAGSVVTKSIPANAFAAGQPARIIRSLV